MKVKLTRDFASIRGTGRGLEGLVTESRDKRAANYEGQLPESDGKEF
jgi:hypothetical protein